MFAVFAVVAALAGCGDGGGPRLERSDAAPLLALAHRIPREGACSQARDISTLRTRVTQLVNARRVPEALQESLSSGVNALVAQTPTCLPPVETATRASADNVRGKGHGHRHGHGHGRKHGDEGGD